MHVETVYLSLYYRWQIFTPTCSEQLHRGLWVSRIVLKVDGWILLLYLLNNHDGHCLLVEVAYAKKIAVVLVTFIQECTHRCNYLMLGRDRILEIFDVMRV